MCEDRFIAIEPNERGTHGWYVEDTWTGKTVCDLYFLRDHSVIHHDNAENNAAIIARAMNESVEY